MAVFALNDEETWLPGFSKGKSLKASFVRLHHQTGEKVKYAIPTAGDRHITVTDKRAIRHLDADPRFTRIS